MISFLLDILGCVIGAIIGAIIYEWIIKPYLDKRFKK